MTNRKSLVLALAAALAAPVAFAQSTGTSATTGTATDASAQTQSTQSTTDAATQATTATQGATTATTDTGAQKKTWADVDIDKDGNLSQTEAAAIPALAQVFAQADGNADGKLSADEYRGYVEKNQAGAASQSQGQNGDTTTSDTKGKDKK
ncbi:MAG TPA: EF-hand domain-containing protein [Lysobacter sp.]|nr:EF-hand domain-containing protein [Lysobacter sp.]